MTISKGERRGMTMIDRRPVIDAASIQTAIRRASRNPQAAAKEQRRASLVGDGTKWRITNFNEVARAMAKQWA